MASTTKLILIIFMVLTFIVVPFVTITSMIIDDEKTNYREGEQTLNPIPFDSVIRHKMTELQERIKNLENLDNQRKQQMSKLHKLDCNRRHSSAPDGTTQLLRLPSAIDFLPNVVSSTSDLISPAIHRVSSKGPRPTATIVFGIPTVNRGSHSYLTKTIDNLISHLTPAEQGEAIFVVMIAETDEDYVLQTTRELEAEFGAEIESGLLEIISPPATFYPNLNQTVQATLGDPLERAIWRTKQSLDFAYLMSFCQSKGLYYVQLEDDIVSKNGYLTDMKTYAIKMTENVDWYLIEFCSLGFIGKMFRARELTGLIFYFLMFRNSKPVDWLIVDLAETKYCGNDKGKKCKKEMDKHWLKYERSLFQHVGVHSSLVGKVQKLKDKRFDKEPGFVAHTNPHMVAETSMQIYQKHTINKLVDGEDFFWSLNPSAGDTITFMFEPPVALSSYAIRSGNDQHYEDRLKPDTLVEVLPAIDLEQGSNMHIQHLNNRTYTVVGHFDQHGKAFGNLSTSYAKILSVRVRCASNSTQWVVLSEIQFEQRQPAW